MKFITKNKAGIILMASAFIIATVNADVLELKDGSVLNGSYQGGTQGTLRFNVKGELKVIAVKDILVLSFTGESTSSTPSSSSSPATATATTVTTKSKGSKTVPSGTVFLVRTSEEIGTHNMKAGQRFSTKLEGKLMAGDVQVAPPGTVVYGSVVKSGKGGIGARKAILELTLTEIMIDGQLRKIKTSNLVGEGQSGGLGRKIVKAAAIGALADGSSGAETGAKVGAGIGILGGGKDAGLKSGTIIEFTLVETLTI